MEPVELKKVVEVTRGHWVGGSVPPSTSVAEVSTDTRSLSGHPLYFALTGKQFDGHEFVDAARRRGAVASVVAEEQLSSLPDHAGPYIAVDDPLSAMERLAKWNRDRLPIKVIAVTGSVGKTSTKEFLGTLLRDRFQVTIAPNSYNNRIGVAATLLAANAQTEVLVTELGTSGPGELSYLSRLVRPDIIVLTEISAAHLEGLRDLSGVVSAKAEIFDGLAPNGKAYVRRGVTGFETFRQRVTGEIHTFGTSEHVLGDEPAEAAARSARSKDYTVTDCQQVDLGDPRSVDGSRAYGYHFTLNGRENFLLPVPGRHNVLNAVAAMSVARELGMTTSELRAALVFCRLPPCRLQVVGMKGVLFVNDCYNASPRSMEAAIEEWSGLSPTPRRPGDRENGGRFSSRATEEDGGRVAILGDMLELGEKSRELHAQIGDLLGRVDLRLLVTIGRDSRWIQEAFEAGGGGAETEHFASVEDAVPFLRKAICSGDHVLIKGSRKIGLERVFKDLHRWVKLFGGRCLDAAPHDGAFRRVPAGLPYA